VSYLPKRKLSAQDIRRVAYVAEVSEAVVKRYLKGKEVRHEDRIVRALRRLHEPEEGVAPPKRRLNEMAKRTIRETVEKILELDVERDDVDVPRSLCLYIYGVLEDSWEGYWESEWHRSLDEAGR
jgi:predicted transcriptional regulator